MNVVVVYDVVDYFSFYLKNIYIIARTANV